MFSVNIARISFHNQMHAMYTEIVISLNMKWTGLQVCLFCHIIEHTNSILLDNSPFFLICFIFILSWGKSFYLYKLAKLCSGRRCSITNKNYFFSQYFLFLELLFLHENDYSYLRLFAKVTTNFSNILKHSHIIFFAVIPKLACWEFLL